MPGIFGLITTWPRHLAQAQLEVMQRVASHDSSYVTGMCVDESLGVYVGWALRPGSFGGGRPIANEDNSVVVLFSGEDYPNASVAARLQREGQAVDWQSASYIARACENDRTFPAGLNGRFHGLAIDRRAGTVTLFNDRSGMHRVYYHESPGAFYFAAEAKAIAAVCPEVREIDPRGLGDYLSCGCVLENRTLFKGVSVLPPGSAWRAREGELRERRNYFHPSEWEEQPELDAEAYYQALRRAFSESLPRYFAGADRIGMSVTGGLDTRMIMAWSRPPEGSIPCYSFAGTYRESHDVRLGRAAAKSWGQPHRSIEVGAEFLSRFPELAELTVFVTDGCADVSSAPILFTNEQARRIAPTRLTGNYGGEVLRGSRMFKATQPLPGLFSPELMPHVSAAQKAYHRILDCHPVTFAVFRQAPWHHHGLFALEGSQLTVRSPFLDNDLVRTAYRAPRTVDGNEVCLRLIADGSPALRAIRTDRGLGTAGIRGKVSRAVLEFSFKVDYAYNHGMPQWLARLDHLLRPWHPERLALGRHKYAHFRIWYRDILSSYVQDVLLDARSLTRGYLDRRAVERIVRSHVAGTGNYTFEIHTLLTLELLHRTLLDGNSSVMERVRALAPTI